MIPIVLVPGLLCTPQIFAPQIPALWPYGPVSVASTLDGSTMQDMAAHILAHCPPRFALAGISMGGYVCLEMMRQAPERVLKLALLDTGARADTAEQIQQRRAMVNSAREAGLEAYLTPALKSMLYPQHSNGAALLDVLVQMASRVGADHLEQQVNAIISRSSSRSLLPRIAVPTWVLVGQDDPWTTPALSEEMARAIPGARLVVVPQCGHASTLEQPVAVNAALADWLDA